MPSKRLSGERSLRWASVRRAAAERRRPSNSSRAGGSRFRSAVSASRSSSAEGTLVTDHEDLGLGSDSSGERVVTGALLRPFAWTHDGRVDLASEMQLCALKGSVQL